MKTKSILPLAFLTLISMSLVAQNYVMSNQSITNCTGTLTDSGASENYGDNEDYTFTIIAPEGAYDLALNFSEWNVEAGYDFLYIYDGADVNADLIGTYSATAPSTINANNGALTIRFTSDSSVNGAGWTANWTSFGRNCGSDTPRTTFVHDCTGTFEDKGGASSNYGDMEDYTVVIAPGAFILTMEFSEWDLEAGYDFLYIHNGPDATSPLIGTYSASSPGTVVATSGSMTLRFVSDESVNKAGWKATWTSGGGACEMPVNKPEANFTTDNAVTNLTTGQMLQFLDQSNNTPDSWSWSFEGGTPATSSYQNPMIAYNQAGTYTVTLTASNADGTDTETKTAYIVVEDPAASGYPLYTMGGDNSASTCVGTIYDSGNETGHYSNDEDYIFTIAPQGAYDLVLNFTSWDIEGGYDFLHIYDGADTNAPLIGTYSETAPSTITSTSGQLTLRFVSDYSVNQAGWSADWTSFGRGCTGTSARYAKNTFTKSLSVFPNPTFDIANVAINTPKEEAVTFILLDLSGRSIQQMEQNIEGETTIQINMNDLEAGVYFLNISSESYNETKRIIKNRR